MRINKLFLSDEDLGYLYDLHYSPSIKRQRLVIAEGLAQDKRYLSIFDVCLYEGISYQDMKETFYLK